MSSHTLKTTIFASCFGQFHVMLPWRVKMAPHSPWPIMTPQSNSILNRSVKGFWYQWPSSLAIKHFLFLYFCVKQQSIMEFFLRPTQTSLSTADCQTWPKVSSRLKPSVQSLIDQTLFFWQNETIKLPLTLQKDEIWCFIESQVPCGDMVQISSV